MRVLVTGAGGFIGSFLVKELVQRGDKVSGLFLPDEDASEAQKLGVKIIRGDLTRPETLTEVAGGGDQVFHLAARVLDYGPAKPFWDVMVDGTRNLLEKVQGNVGRFVYFSSIAALGMGRDLVGLNEDAKRVKCGIHYGDTKIAAEDLIADYCGKNEIPYTIIRPANVIGPGSVWVREILDMFRQGPFPLIAGGKNPTSFVYIDNLIDGTLLAAQSKKAAGRIFHFRDDYDMTWKEYVTTLGSWIGKKPAGNLPFGVAWAAGALLEATLPLLGIRPPITRFSAELMGRNNDVDSSRARKELGWESKVGLNEAMERLEQWVRDVYVPNIKSKK